LLSGVFLVSTFSYHEVDDSGYPGGSQRIFIGSDPPCFDRVQSCYTGTVVEQQKSKISYGTSLFFLSFIKDNVMLGHFALQAVCFVRYKAEFVLQRKCKLGGPDYAEIHGKDSTGETSRGLYLQDGAAEVHSGSRVQGCGNDTCRKQMVRCRVPE
ncbi:hypothetical protein VU11_06330, partial [Desulfobulbus sp. US2]|nr:hypothetical protein [Desulfobulbus sp. US2]